MMTRDNFCKRGDYGPNCFPLCKREDELVDHPLVHYSITQQVWTKVARSLNVSFSWAHGSFDESLYFWFSTCVYCLISPHSLFWGSRGT